MSLEPLGPSSEARISGSSPLHENDGFRNNQQDWLGSPRTATSDIPMRQRTSKSRIMIPSGVEVIDLDSLPEPSPFIKNEPIDLDAIEVKTEPIDDNLRSFGPTLFQWTNTADEPILIDDDEDPPEPVSKQPTTKASSLKMSPPAKIVMVHQGDMISPELKEPYTPPSILENMDIDTTGPPIAVRTLIPDHTPFSGSTNLRDSDTAPTSTGGVNLGPSISQTQTKVGGRTNSSFRDRLKAAQQKAKVAIIARQNPIAQTEMGVQSSTDGNTPNPASESERHISVPKEGNTARQDDLELDSDREYEHECQRFESAKRAYEERKRTGQSSVEKDIQFMQITTEYERQRKRKEDQECDQEEVLT
jgi:hypothetical protein